MRPNKVTLMTHRDAKVKYDALEQTATLLKLEKEEFSKEISKLHKENEQLKTKCKALEQQHTEILHNKQSMANILSSKSTALDASHLTIEKQQAQILEQQQKIKVLTSSNNDLIIQNNQYKQRLEEINNQTIQRNEIYAKEKDAFVKQIELLHHNIEHLQYLLHAQTSSPVQHCKCNETNIDNKGAHRRKTIRFSLPLKRDSLTSLDDGVLDTHRDSICNISAMNGKGVNGKRLSGKRMSVKRMSGMGYMGVYEFRMASLNGTPLNGTPHLGPLMDSPQTDGSLFVNDEYLEYDMGTMHLTDEYEQKLAELVSKHKKETEILTGKYQNVLQRLEEIESAFDHKLRIIQDLRARNSELANNGKGTKCYILDWF